MKIRGTLIFTAIISILYITFITCDIFYLEQSRILKFITVCLLAICSFFCKSTKESRVSILTFLFTVVADVFFVLLNKPIFGITVYIIIQLTHTVRLSLLSEKNIGTELVKRIVPALIVGVIGSFIGPVVMLALPYAVCLGINIVHGIENNVRFKSKNNLLYGVALIILAIGDIGVGLRNVQLDFMTQELEHVAYIVTWVTYIPSLMLILTSTGALNFKDKPEKELIHN